MKSFVITIASLPESNSCADRCIESANKFGINPIKYDAFTPKDDPISFAQQNNINTKRFEKNAYSRYLNSLSCFISHFLLWKKCVEQNETILILEHDAVFERKLPDIDISMLVSFGKPSYGKFNTKQSEGLYPLFSKRYLPGAHCYAVTPKAASKLIKYVTDAEPTDVYLNSKRFPWIQEYYPWPVICDDSFSTVQVTKGCIVKHNYSENYKLLESHK